MKYLVIGSGGPGFASEEEAVVILEGTVLPSFKEHIALEKGKKRSLPEAFLSETGHLSLSRRRNPTMNWIKC